jgi:hypothetical protein
MRDILLLMIGVISVAGSVPYIRNVLRGKSKPNLVTWSTWSLLNIIIVVSALAAGGATNTVVMGASFFIVSSTILCIALFKGTRKYSLFDGVCQGLAILGVVLWQLSNNPNIALLFVILADCFAIIPTYRHAYLYPHEETWITYLIGGLVALALTALATPHTFASLAVTIESALINLLLTGLILVQGTKQRTAKMAKV